MGDSRMRLRFFDNMFQDPKAGIEIIIEQVIDGRKLAQNNILKLTPDQIHQINMLEKTFEARAEKFAKELKP